MQETLCWKCQNCTRCSWADGIPVKGWTATPTIVRDYDGDISSYMVEKCPNFKEDAKKEVSTAEIAKILGKTEGVVIYSLRTRGGIIFLRNWLKEKGYRFIISVKTMKNGKEKRDYIVEKLPSHK